MTEESRGSVESPGEPGFTPPDAPAEPPADRLVVSREAAQAAAPAATMLDGMQAQQQDGAQSQWHSGGQPLPQQQKSEPQPNFAQPLSVTLMCSAFSSTCCQYFAVTMWASG